MPRACNLCKNDRARHLFTKYGYPILKCKSCGLVYTDIQIDNLPFKEFYNEEYYLGGNKIGYFNYILNKDTFRKNYSIWVKEIANYKPQGNLLDVGCGPGFFLDIARGEGWNVTGVEVSGFASQYVRNTFNINTINDNFLNASLPRDYFDVVSMWDVIEHLSDPLKAINKVYDLLRGRGIFVLLTGDIDSMLSKLMGRRWRMMTPPLHLYYFSINTISPALEKNGFKILKIIRPGKFVSLDLFLYQLCNLYLPNLQQLAKAMSRKVNLSRFGCYMNLKDEILVIAKKE